MTTKRQSLNSMTVDELRRVYLREVGRPTEAINKNYLISKIGLARKGRIVKGPLPPRKRRDDRGHGTINLRLSSGQLEALDEAVNAHGGNRSDFLRVAIEHRISDIGLDELAKAFAA